MQELHCHLVWYVVSADCCWLQVHDEVILEGPKESSVEAQRLVLDCMERPFDGRNPLLVDLVVDSKIADTWYEAK